MRAPSFLISGFGLTVCFLALNAHAAAEDPLLGFYNETYTEQTADQKLQISVREEIHTQLRVHKEVLAQSPVLAVALRCPDSTTIPYDFETDQQAEAFKKALAFLYKSSEIVAQQDEALLLALFEPNGLPELIFQTIKYKFDILGHTFAYFLYKQVDRLHTAQKSQIWLDGLTQEQLHQLYKTISHIANQTKLSSDWVQQSKGYLDRYGSIRLQQDLRLEGLDINVDPNACQAAWARERLLDDAAKGQAARDQKLRRDKEFDDQAVRIKDEIIAKFSQDIRKNGIKKRTYWVPLKFAQSVFHKLTTDLPAYSIRITPDAHRPWHDAEVISPCNQTFGTLGYCLAQTVGQLTCLALYPIQLFTCNYFDCCCKNPPKSSLDYRASHYDPLVSCQMAGAVARCAYNAGSCCHHSISITPTGSVDAGLNLLPPPAPPPAEKMNDADE